MALGNPMATMSTRAKLRNIKFGCYFGYDLTGQAGWDAILAARDRTFDPDVTTRETTFAPGRYRRSQQRGRDIGRRDIMVTTVGNETNLNGLIEDLLHLEHDAIAAYEQTIARLENPDWKRQIAEFKGDHDRHVQELSSLAGQVGANVPREGDMKQMLTTGKIAMASMMGDKTILGAMRTNEEDTVTAYERASRNQEATPEARQIFERAHSDELRHREWMMTTANS